MARLARQLGQAADQAARHKERNPHVDIEPAARAAMKIAARRFARRELRPIITRRQQEKETDRLHEEAMQRMKPAGCYDQRGNKIPCPVQYRAYESVVSATRAYFDDFGNLVREEVVGNIAVETPMKQTSSSNPVWGYGLEASLLGDALAFGDHFTYNKDFWLGKNGKFYGSNWGGNKVYWRQIQIC